MFFAMFFFRCLVLSIDAVLLVDHFRSTIFPKLYTPTVLVAVKIGSVTP